MCREMKLMQELHITSMDLMRVPLRIIMQDYDIDMPARGVVSMIRANEQNLASPSSSVHVSNQDNRLGLGPRSLVQVGRIARLSAFKEFTKESGCSPHSSFFIPDMQSACFVSTIEVLGPETRAWKSRGFEGPPPHWVCQDFFFCSLFFRPWCCCAAPPLFTFDAITRVASWSVQHQYLGGVHQR